MTFHLLFSSKSLSRFHHSYLMHWFFTWRLLTFCSAMYSNVVGGAKEATFALSLANKRTRSPLARIQDGYWNKTFTPPLCVSHGKIECAWTLNTNSSLQSTWKWTALNIFSIGLKLAAVLYERRIYQSFKIDTKY